MTEKPAPKSPAVSYAAAILRFLADQAQPPGLTAIARAVSMSPSSCLNVLRTLVHEGFVSFDAETKSYAIGSAIIVLAHRALDPDNVMRVARDALRRLAKDTGATAALWRVANDQRLTLVGFESDGTDMRLHMTVGQRIPLLAGAAGRSVTAATELSPERLRSSFARMRWERAPTFEQYVDDLEQSRARGWSLDHGTYRRGVTSFAAAVLDGDGVPQFSVSAVRLGDYHDPDMLDQVGTATLSAARRVRQLLYGVAP